MDPTTVTVGWRGLSLAVGARLGRPIGLSRVRHRVESSGLAIGAKIGGVLVFSEEDVEAAVRTVAAARR